MWIRCNGIRERLMKILLFVTKKYANLLPPFSYLFRKYFGNEEITVVSDKKLSMHLGEKFSYYLCPIVSTERKQFIKNFDKKIKIQPLTFIHKLAYISKNSIVNSGSMVCPNVAISAYTQIKNHCIINRGATIGHDCIIDSYSTIGPGVNIAGNVKIGQQTSVGIGANILENITIGNNCVIGAGALVTKDIPDNETWWGVPAKYVR